METPGDGSLRTPKCFSRKDPNSSLSNRINASVSQKVHFRRAFSYSSLPRHESFVFLSLF